MSRIIVYLEGSSDKAAMEALLAPLIRQQKQQGTTIGFVSAPRGDSKKSLLLKVPEKAVNILANQPESFVAVVPDLYPRNRGFPHQTEHELREGVLERFRAAVRRKKTRFDLEDRFQVFCFKHDLEALVLASHESLANRLDNPKLKPTWRVPVEDQDHEHPPRRVVEELFQRHGRVYRPVIDAPLILGASHYEMVAERCLQCFGPLVDFLRSSGSSG